MKTTLLSSLCENHFLFLLVALFVFVGCGAQINTLANTLSTREWEVKRLSINERAFRIQKGALLTFDIAQHRIFGNTGCNNYAATFEFGEKNISISRKTYTRKLCHDEELMYFEFEFLRNLEGEFIIASLEEYLKTLTPYQQITNPDLFKRKDSKEIIVFFNRFKAYFLTQNGAEAFEMDALPQE
ncbi:META domain-containing protein [Helicobacter himalayensis]|uniref:META domain-containing protein n=1 Tax=Helicobacter himalayensis TaxID=1591088 RepID=UPI0008351536|nr:META domain-containing protein [Helicobacter himalayensis]